MTQLFKPLLWMMLVLLVLVIPFLIWGDLFDERQVRIWVAEVSSPAIVAGLIAAILATDIFLPIPSSVVSTVAGVVLGVGLGTLASWVGMTAGACLGYGLARLLGRPLARRFSSDEELDRMDQLSARYGPLILILARGVPVMAEASVLLLGTAKLSWWRFFPPVAAANLGLALAYAAFGDLADRYAPLPIVLAVSVALPVLAAMVATRLYPDDSAGASE